MQFITLLIVALLGTASGFTGPLRLTSVRNARPSSLNLADLSHVSDFVSSSIAISDVSDSAPTLPATVSYSKASYYTVLGLFILSVPGIWSQIKRSTAAKIKRKTFTSAGENANGKDLRQQAAEIMAYMKANNYEVAEAGKTITFRGIVQRSTSQAFFLVFCTALGMASLALVLQIQFQNLSLPLIGEPNWYLLILLSPLAGGYYWAAGDRVDEVQVKLSCNDDETENLIAVQGNDDELERLWRTLDLKEKGMVKVEGILET